MQNVTAKAQWMIHGVACTVLAVFLGACGTEQSSTEVPLPPILDPTVQRLQAERQAFFEARPIYPPIGEDQERSAAICEEVRQLIREREYQRAYDLSIEAEHAAPAYRHTYALRADAAYLAGKVARTTKALRMALEIEPENPLWQLNLERIEAEPPRLRP